MSHVPGMPAPGQVVVVGAARPVIGRSASARVSGLSSVIVTDNSARGLPFGPGAGRRRGPRVFGRETLTG